MRPPAPSCWFYCRAMKWQSLLTWIGSTVGPRHQVRRCCWHPSSCTAVSHKVFESSALRAFGAQITGPSHLPFPAQELSKTVHGLISTHCPSPTGNWILLLEIMGEGGCQSHRWGGNKKAGRSWTAWSSSALPFTFFLRLVSTPPCMSRAGRWSWGSKRPELQNGSQHPEGPWEDPHVNLMRPNKVNYMVLSLCLSKPEYQYRWRMY